MTNELDKKLVKKYPKIFADRYGDMRNTAMCWGFECGDGWYNIIDLLCSDLQWNTDNNNKDYVIKNKFLRKFIPILLKLTEYIPKFKHKLRNKISNWRSNLEFIYVESNRYPQVVATQVKEKFGGLRFYERGASERQYAVISFVESLSYNTCEKCGSMKDIGRTEGWISTLCKDCADPDSNWKLLTETNKE